MLKKSSKKLAITPLCDRVVITPRPEAPKGDRHVGGIIIPESGEKKLDPNPFYVGEVLAIGDECKRVKVGDRIIVDGPHSFRVWVDEDAIECRMIREQNIVAVLK